MALRAYLRRGIYRKSYQTRRDDTISITRVLFVLYRVYCQVSVYGPPDAWPAMSRTDMALAMLSLGVAVELAGLLSDWVRFLRGLM